MNGLVCVDANFCVWGVKNEGDEARREDAVYLLKRFDRDKKTVLLPAPVITELIMPVSDPNDRAKLMQVLNTFRVGAMDMAVAVEAGKIWNSEEQTWKGRYEPGTTSMKHYFKYDMLILATAIVNRAETLYTGDARLAGLARTYGQGMKVIDLWKDDVRAEENRKGEHINQHAMDLRKPLPPLADEYQLGNGSGALQRDAAIGASDQA